MTIKEMLEARAAAIAKAKALVDAASDAKRELTADEKKQYDGHVAEAERQLGEIAKLSEAASGTAGAEEAARAMEAVRKAERERAKEIESICRVSNLSDDFKRKHIDDGTSIDEVRKLAFAELANRSAEGGRTETHVRLVRDEVDTRRALAENAVMNRCNPAVKLEEGAREFRGFTLIDLGRHLLERRGIRTGGLTRMELAGAALGLSHRDGAESTSDLANVLANVMNKTLRRQYEGTQRTFVQWARASTNPDFKQISRTILSGAPSLLKIDESGEYKRGAVTDGKETYSLATYGRTVAFSRQSLINDDLNALTRLPQLMGQAAGDLESDTVYAVLTDNAALADGGNLFNSTATSSTGGHKNLAGTAAAISVSTLNEGRAAIRVQKGLEGRVINLAPRYLVVPSAKEATAYQFTSSQYTPTTAGDINEFRAGGRTALTPIVEPRLDASSTTAWYLMADPAQIDTVEYCYLEGNEGVFTETRVGFDVDGVEMKVRHDFAAKALDFRGMFKNGGA